MHATRVLQFLAFLLLRAMPLVALTPADQSSTGEFEFHVHFEDASSGAGESSSTAVHESTRMLPPTFPKSPFARPLPPSPPPFAKPMYPPPDTPAQTAEAVEERKAEMAASQEKREAEKQNAKAAAAAAKGRDMHDWENDNPVPSPPLDPNKEPPPGTMEYFDWLAAHKPTTDKSIRRPGYRAVKRTQVIGPECKGFPTVELKSKGVSAAVPVAQRAYHVLRSRT